MKSNEHAPREGDQRITESSIYFDGSKLSREAAERLVTNLYRGFLHREAEPDAVHHWAGELCSGMSPVLLTDTLLTSDEYQTTWSTPLFRHPGHFYSPICNTAEAESHLERISASIADKVPGVTIDRAAMINTWHELLPFLLDAPFPDSQSEGFRYWFDNPAYAWGDGSILQAMIRLHKPRRVIEIGSGWSSACTADTVERYLNNQCALTFIDPYPKLVEDLLGGSAASARIFPSRVQDVPLNVFDDLEAGDILFIDSTHVLRTGSDVCRELFEILPRLRSGVFVHIHDMFWPFEYPWDWVVGENRSWNELQAVRAFLMGNVEWEVFWFSDYMVKLELPLLEATYPKLLRNPGGALWLRRC